MDSVEPQPSVRLGAYLLCPPGSIDAALGRQALLASRARRRRIGDILLEDELVSPEALRAAIAAQRVDRLRGCSLFADSSHDELRHLGKVFEEVTAETGELLIHQGGDETHLYVLASGTLEVFRTDAEGEEVALALVRPGEPVGEMGYVTGGSRTAYGALMGQVRGWAPP
jgi:CRP-like cAMP-binding protein